MEAGSVGLRRSLDDPCRQYPRIEVLVSALHRKPFSHPTVITNPLFPISRLRSVVLLGRLQGRRWRAETTLLQGTTTVDWMGQRIAARRSQFLTENADSVSTFNCPKCVDVFDRELAALHAGS